VVHPDRAFNAEALRSWLATQLRASKTPDRIEQWDDLPHTATGKLVRRQVPDLMAKHANGKTPA
jgi:acyl-coenzyme A synthetase/AMP-(fatty) acid ligase